MTTIKYHLKAIPEDYFFNTNKPLQTDFKNIQITTSKNLL